MADFEYAVVEILGHRRHVGRISEVERFGARMLRVDVPTEDAADAGDFELGFETTYYGVAAIFAITPTTIEAVFAANRPYRPRTELLSAPRADFADFAFKTDGEEE